MSFPFFVTSVSVFFQGVFLSLFRVIKIWIWPMFCLGGQLFFLDAMLWFMIGWFFDGLDCGNK